MARARGINSEDTLAVIFERRGEGKGRKRDGNKRKTGLKRIEAGRSKLKGGKMKGTKEGKKATNRSGMEWIIIVAAIMDWLGR